MVLVAVTAPGTDVLPWDPDHCAELGGHRHSGKLGCRVVRDLADEWNEDASLRYATLWKAATMAADRWVRRLGSARQAPVRVAVVWSEQKRGVWHVHEALPAGTPIELEWSRRVVEYVRRNAGRYGWGNVDRNPLGDSAAKWGGESAARYLASNASSYLAQNVSEGHGLPGRRLRSYVSRRLTTRTGVTMRNLRRARYLYVCLRDGLPLPEWSDVDLERVWSVLVAANVGARAP